jgi:hypothetical protein
MIRMSCNVQFVKILPFDMQKYPFILWVSIGRHRHPPPDINKTPEFIRTGLITLIQRISDPVMTRSKLNLNLLVIVF